MGVLFAIGTLFAWGLDDFFIQRTTRKIGVLKSLFAITALATILLLPFVKNEIVPILSEPSNLLLILIAALTGFLASLTDFQALKQGKIAVVETVVSLELPLTVGIGLVFLKEQVKPIELSLIAVIFTGILLVIITRWSQKNWHAFFERGTIYALGGAAGLAIFNVLTALTSQATAPLAAIWFIHTLIAVFTLVLLVRRRDLGSLAADFRAHPALISAPKRF